MKREDILGIIVYLVILVLAVVFGVTVIQSHYSDNFALTAGHGVGLYVVYVLAALIVGIVFNAIIYELGHMIGAKASHYIITSVNILGFGWYREGEKFKFHFKSFDGLTGETKIIPQDGKEETSNPRWYLLLGTILYAIEIVVVIIFFSIYRNVEGLVSDIVYFFLIVAVVGAVIVVYNILPFRLDSMNDGYRLRMTSNKANRYAYNALLKSDYLIAQGEKDVEIPVFDQITNFTADLNLNKVYLLLDDKKFDEAELILDQIIESKETVSEKTYIRMFSQKIYINLFTKSLEEAKAYYDENVPQETRRLISKDNSMASIRAYILMSGLLDRSQSECELTIERVKKAFKSTPENRKQTEMKLYNEAILKVDELHPEWGLKEHLLQDTKVK